jgi:hypothetical protein
MRWTLFCPIAAALICGIATAADTEERPSSSLLPANTLTREQFKALSPDAVIESDGERMTKREFIERRTKALERAINEMHGARAKTEAEFEAKRKAFLDSERAKLEEANKKVQDEIARLVAADAAAHGANWEARKRQAADLLQQAKRATSMERSALEKQAADLLAPPGR